VPGRAAGKALTLLLALLVASYVGINLMGGLPAFLVGENLALAAGYALGLALHLRGRGHLYTASLAWFNAGRVSRSIVSPAGELGSLALQHLPLLALLVLVGVLSTLEAARRR
jgi:formate/nitrite transporter FocA (FNT family)